MTTLYGIYRNAILVNLDGASDDEERADLTPVYTSEEEAQKAIDTATVPAKVRRELFITPLRVVG